MNPSFSISDFNKLFYLNTQPMWFFDSKTLHFLEVNDAAVWVYGYSRTEFMAMTLHDIRPTEAEDQALLQAAHQELDGDRCYMGPVRHRLRDGTLREVQVTCFAVKHGDRDAHLAIPQLVNTTQDSFQMNKFMRVIQFNVLQKMHTERQRLDELRTLTTELEAGMPLTRQVAIIARMKMLLDDAPHHGLN